ncbi:MAG: hypothetical protein U0575_12560 [Phycisphaerales bacterium]
MNWNPSTTTQLRLLVALAILPLVELESSFDEDRPALDEVLGHHFGGRAPCLAVDEGDFLALLALGGLVAPIDGDADVRDREIAVRVPQLDVAGEVPHQEDLVVAGHRWLPAFLEVRWVSRGCGVKVRSRVGSAAPGEDTGAQRGVDWVRLSTRCEPMGGPG